MKLAFIVFIPFIGAFVPPLAIQAGRNVCAAATAAVTGLALLLLLTEAATVYSGGAPRTDVRWLPQIGLLSFLIDGLGLFFAALILIIGLLIILYASSYLARADPM